MDYAAFLQAAGRGQPPPVALLHGPDPQLLDDALAAATRGLFREPSEAALGREIFEGTEVSVDDVVRAASTLPFMSAMRLVAVRRCQALPAKGADALAAYTRNPNPSTALVLLADESLGASRDRREHWLLAAVPGASIVSLAMREGRSAESWLRQRAATEGLTVSEEAARLLVQWVGDDGASLLGEARKAALAGGPENRAVGVKEVTAVVGEHRLAGVFDLTRAIERRDVGLALKTLDRLLVTEDAMRLIAMLTSEVRVGWSIHELDRRGQSVNEIAR